MNKTFNSYESNCRPIRLNKGTEKSALDLIGDLLVKLFSAKGLGILRVIVTLFCFVGFVGVLGGLEAGNLSAGGAVVLSAFMVFVEILCFAPSRRK